MADEEDATGGRRGGGGDRRGTVTKGSGGLAVDVPHVTALATAVTALTTALGDLDEAMGKFKGKGDAVAKEYKKVEDQLKDTAKAAEALHGSLGKASTASVGDAHTPAPATPFAGMATPAIAAAPTAGAVAATAAAKPAVPGTAAAATGATTGGTTPSAPPPVNPGGGGGGIVSNATNAYSNAGGGTSGLIAAGISGVMGGIKKMQDIIGAVASAGVQFVGNRIDGPTGNRNATMQMAQALAPAATMNGLRVQDMIKGLAQQTPVQGSQSDIIGTVMSGLDIGAQLRGTPQRNGFFQGVREMQALTPGVGAGQLSSSLGGYMQNTQSQQRGVMYGQGAFTMMGQGGKYKSLGEWAVGITKFLEQQRPGKKRGSNFTTEELLAQNFPGSNVNAWFQMMGVPEDMVSYWWQYVMTKARSGASSSGADKIFGSETGLATAVKAQRGIDLGAQRLDTVTQSARRDFLMGTEMYPMYNVKEQADKRFNVAMQKADLDVGQMARETKIGQMMSMLPTTITDLLMPLLTKFAGSKLGAVAAAGSMLGLSGGDVDFGDPIGDIGDYSSRGQTGTAHLAPGLAKAISSMQRANPNVKVTSGMRDTSTQNRLHRGGVGKVGPATRSKHTRGWAADLGPRSQMGWINANAHKHGLQTAKNQGEPWHVQQAGTMHMGDPGTGNEPIGDWWKSITEGNIPIVSDVASFFTDKGDKLKFVLKYLLGGGKDDKTGADKGTGETTGISGTIDNVINKFIRIMLAPTFGLAGAFGDDFTKAKFMDSEAAGVVNSKDHITLDYGKYLGFSPATDPTSGSLVFGDPPSPGMARFSTMLPSLSHMSGGGVHVGATSRPSISIVNHIIVQGGSGNRMDAQRTAGILANHVEKALTDKLARAT